MNVGDAVQVVGEDLPHTCMLLLQVTYYEFRKEEVDAALEGHKKHQLTHVPSRIENKEAFNILMVHTSVSLSACSAPAISLCKALLLVILMCKAAPAVLARV